MEVFWQGHVESVSFPLPPEAKYLASATREDFLRRVDLSTAEKRMKMLIKVARPPLNQAVPSLGAPVPKRGLRDRSHP